MSNSNDFHTLKIGILRNVTSQEKKKEPHFHNYHEFMYIIRGKARVSINDRDYDAGPNSMLAISNLEKHHWKTLELPFERYCIMFKPEYFQAAVPDQILSSVFRNRPNSFIHLLQLTQNDSEHLLNLVHLMEAEIQNEKAYWEINLKSLFQLFIISLYRNYSSFFPVPALNKTTALILEVQKFIECNCQNEINLVDIARKHYIDRYYLSHQFKNVTGFSFKEYLILQRIAKAKELICHSTENITEIALSSGFNNINHFIRIFKKYEGITPYQYRKRMKSKLRQATAKAD